MPEDSYQEGVDDEEEESDEELSTQQISLPLIETRCLTTCEPDADEREKYEAMLTLTRIDLDRQRIGFISGLDTFSCLRHLSLCRNRIKRIGGLEMLPQLEVLSLAENEISRIEGIQHLNLLYSLDLAENKIKAVESRELSAAIPSTLVSLQLNGNPCAWQANYRTTVVSALSALMELDCIQVDPVERVAAQRTERLQTPAGRPSSRGNFPAAPTPRTKARQEELAGHVGEVYNAAMADATGKLAEMQSGFESRIKERAEARRQRRLQEDNEE